MSENLMGNIVADMETRANEIKPTVDALAKLEADIKADRYTRQALQEEIFPARDDLKRKITAAKAAARDSVAGMVQARIAELHRADALDPADLTDDYRLLTGGVPLTENDVRAMLDRNRTNRTMVQMVLRYAKAHGIETGVSYLDNDEQIRTLQGVPGSFDAWVDHWMTSPRAVEVLHQMYGA